MHGPLNLVLVSAGGRCPRGGGVPGRQAAAAAGLPGGGHRIGPHALGWVPEREGVSYLAEFGVVFLMFSIGLEFSLPKLFTMRHLVFGLGIGAGGERHCRVAGRLVGAGPGLAPWV